MGQRTKERWAERRAVCTQEIAFSKGWREARGKTVGTPALLVPGVLPSSCISSLQNPMSRLFLPSPTVSPLSFFPLQCHCPRSTRYHTESCARFPRRWLGTSLAKRGATTAAALPSALRLVSRLFTDNPFRATARTGNVAAS
ncbi:hypothetical protein TRVL_04156 [Trypanosoma vivax]|nr:hypothetical protein TRVL_04156 [Trypanosoma vivax]